MNEARRKCAGCGRLTPEENLCGGYCNDCNLVFPFPEDASTTVVDACMFFFGDMRNNPKREVIECLRCGRPTQSYSGTCNKCFEEE